MHEHGGLINLTFCLSAILVDIHCTNLSKECLSALCTEMFSDFFMHSLDMDLEDGFGEIQLSTQFALMTGNLRLKVQIENVSLWVCSSYYFLLTVEFQYRVHEIRRTRRTCPANFENVRRRGLILLDNLSGKRKSRTMSAE